MAYYTLTELEIREKLISRIETAVGYPLSVPYENITTSDLERLLQALSEKDPP